MFHRILVPIDGSPTSSQGLEEAIALAKNQAARVCLLHVVDELVVTQGLGGAMFVSASYVEDFTTALRENGSKLLAKAEKRVRQHRVRVETKLPGCARPASRRRDHQAGEEVARRRDRTRYARPAWAVARVDGERRRVGRARGTGPGPPGARHAAEAQTPRRAQLMRHHARLQLHVTMRFMTALLSGVAPVQPRFLSILRASVRQAARTLDAPPYRRLRFASPRK